MEKYRPIDKQLLEACQDYPPDFGVIKALLEQGADVNAVSAADPDECLLTEIIFDYPWIFWMREDACARCEDENCDGCSLNYPDADGRYLPQIIRLFLEHGFDARSRMGAMALVDLTHCHRDRYILDCCKLLLSAGASPEMAPYSDDNESSLSAVGLKAFMTASWDEDPAAANLYELLYLIMEAKTEGRDYGLLEYHGVCVGRRIDRMLLCTEDANGAAKRKRRLGSTFVLDCQGKLLCVDRCADVFVDPNVPQNALKQINVSARFPGCAGHTIEGIDFSLYGTVKGERIFGPAVLIRLDNGKVLRFTANHSEGLPDDTAAWFEVDG